MVHEVLESKQLQQGRTQMPLNPGINNTLHFNISLKEKRLWKNFYKTIV